MVISPDDSIDDNNINEYDVVERDDLLFYGKDKWNVSKDRSTNKDANYDKSHNFVHANRFSNLNINENIEVANDEPYDCNPSTNNISNTQLINTNKSRPHVVTQEYPEGNFIKTPIRPGVNPFNIAVKDGKTTVVFSTSIAKRINNREFNKEYRNGTVRIRRFHGARAKQMKHYVLPTLVDESPQVVVLQCGGNDLPTTKMNPTPVETIAKYIVDTAKICENHGATQILISGIITRKKQAYMEKRRRDLNNLLQDMCYDFGYIYIDNDNIKLEHLFVDGVHLDRDGSDILACNLLHSLNNVF